MAKILIVEDNSTLAEVVSDELEVERHHVEVARTGTDAEGMLRVYQYDLIILDWELPGVPGLDILLQLRGAGKLTPVLMLTGKGALQDKETGLDAGADDYLTKPFELKELTARVRALLRRASNRASNTLSAGYLVLDPAKHSVRKNGEDVLLSPKEFALLEFFMRNKNIVHSLDSILDRVWKSDSESSVETVRVWLKRLRDKIDIKEQPSIIRTVHGFGYKLED